MRTLARVSLQPDARGRRKKSAEARQQAAEDQVRRVRLHGNALQDADEESPARSERVDETRAAGCEREVEGAGGVGRRLDSSSERGEWGGEARRAAAVNELSKDCIANMIASR